MARKKRLRDDNPSAPLLKRGQLPRGLAGVIAQIALPRASPVVSSRSACFNKHAHLCQRRRPIIIIHTQELFTLKGTRPWTNMFSSLEGLRDDSAKRRAAWTPQFCVVGRASKNRRYKFQNRHPCPGLRFAKCHPCAPHAMLHGKEELCLPSNRPTINSTRTDRSNSEVTHQFQHIHEWYLQIRVLCTPGQLSSPCAASSLLGPTRLPKPATRSVKIRALREGPSQREPNANPSENSTALPTSSSSKLEC